MQVRLFLDNYANTVYFWWHFSQQYQYRRDKKTIALILYDIQHGIAVLMYAQKGV